MHPVCLFFLQFPPIPAGGGGGGGGCVCFYPASSIVLGRKIALTQLLCCCGQKQSSRYAFFSLWPHPWPMEVPRPGTESELQPRPTPQLPPNGTLNPLHWARDQTRTSLVTPATAVRFLTHCATAGTPHVHLNSCLLQNLLCLSGV